MKARLSSQSTLYANDKTRPVYPCPLNGVCVHSRLGCRTNLHYDNSHNLLCVVSGKKRVTMFPPTKTLKLAPHPLWGESSNHSQIDVKKPNLCCFPEFVEAEHYKIIVELTVRTKQCDKKVGPCLVKIERLALFLDTHQRKMSSRLLFTHAGRRCSVYPRGLLALRGKRGRDGCRQLLVDLPAD